MLARVTSCATVGIEGLLVEVEADLGVGLPTFTIVGLPDAAVRESRERVLAAVRNCGFEFPARKITVNLAPANVRKEGPRFDLPIAVAILLASGQLPAGSPFERGIFVGELALDGALRPVRGILPVLAAARAAERGPVWIPLENAPEGEIYPDVTIAALGALSDLREDAPGARRSRPPATRGGGSDGVRSRAAVAGEGAAAAGRGSAPDLSEVRGQGMARRALEVAAAGGHNLLLVGPPGAGKTMLARRIPGILPPLSREEAIEVSTVHSVAGRLPAGAGLVAGPPFRAPHHTISTAGLVGGGRGPWPGEAALAHRGVLFLDELPEFRRDAIEALREPLEEGAVTIARAGGAIRFPASFALVGAMNSCPCGFRGDSRRACRCAPDAVARYWSKVSGPILDRIDLLLEIPALPMSDLMASTGGEASSSVRARVLGARAVAEARNAGGRPNARLASSELEPLDDWGAAARAVLERAAASFSISARGLLRVRRVARTIADLRGGGALEPADVAEALQFRFSARTTSD